MNRSREGKELERDTMPPNEAPLAHIYPEAEEPRTTTSTLTARVSDNQIRIEDKLYSTAKLAELHPGGPLFIKVKLYRREYQLQFHLRVLR